MTPYRFRVAWFDCDPAGIAFYARLLAYVNEAAHDFLEKAGCSIGELQRVGLIGVPLISLSVDFKSPLSLGEHAAIDTELLELGRSSLRFRHCIRNQDRLILQANEVRVLTARREDGSIGSAPPPDTVRAALTAVLGSRET